jgi:hypothetical protein
MDSDEERGALETWERVVRSGARLSHRTLDKTEKVEMKGHTERNRHNGGKMLSRE